MALYGLAQESIEFACLRNSSSSSLFLLEADSEISPLFLV